MQVYLVIEYFPGYETFTHSIWDNLKLAQDSIPEEHANMFSVETYTLNEVKK